MNISIGNYVQVENPEHHPKLKGVILEVVGFQKRSDGVVYQLEVVDKKPNTYYESYSQFGEFVKPIKITHDLLIKFGFENKETCYNFSRMAELGHDFGDFALSFYDHSQIKIWRGDRYCGVFHCEFLHELQNLFYSLNYKNLSF